MNELKVDDAAVASFAAALRTHAGPVGAECVATGQTLGSGLVNDALGNVVLVLSVMDDALAGGAVTLADDAGAAGQSWSTLDASMSMRAG